VSKKVGTRDEKKPAPDKRVGDAADTPEDQQPSVVLQSEEAMDLVLDLLKSATMLLEQARSPRVAYRRKKKKSGMDNPKPADNEAKGT